MPWMCGSCSFRNKPLSFVTASKSIRLCWHHLPNVWLRVCDYTQIQFWVYPSHPTDYIIFCYVHWCQFHLQIQQCKAFIVLLSVVCNLSASQLIAHVEAHMMYRTFANCKPRNITNWIKLLRPHIKPFGLEIALAQGSISTITPEVWDRSRVLPIKTLQ